MFQNLGLNSQLLQAITMLGYEQPTPIQSLTIPLILDTKTDLVALAQTGTGKTAAFGLPILQLVDTSKKYVQALILSPTRELALQITNDFQQYSQFMSGVKILAVYGGSSIETQINQLKRGIQIVIGTPGRILDLIKRNKLKINKVHWLVLDEADEMLNMGFREELDAILETLPKNKQTLLFSATMPSEVREISDGYLNNPKEIVVGQRNTGAKNVAHEYYIVKEKNRYLALKRLIDYEPDIYAIVFCRTRAQTRDIASSLINDGYNADALHGDLSQSQRDFVMKRFRAKQINILVATDVAARGLDVSNLTHIIHFNLPDDPEVYIHRSGRTARAGKKGVSQILATPSEIRKLPVYERITGKSFKKKLVPNGKEVYKKRLFSYASQIENTILEKTEFDKIFDEMINSLFWLSKDDLLKRIFYIELKRFIEISDDNQDLNEQEISRTKHRNKRRANKSEFTRYFLNIGKKDNLNARKLIGLINQLTDSNDIEIGKIDVQRNFSFFDIESKAKSRLENAFRKAHWGSQTLRLERVKNKPKRKLVR